MAFTVRIPQSYAARIVNSLASDIGTSISAGQRITKSPVAIATENLNVQPDGSILVRSESAETPYQAYIELFNQNLGIPLAAIRGFETLADTGADANRYGTGIATTSEKNAAIGAAEITPSRRIAPEDITSPLTGTGGVNVEDLTFDERRALGEMPFGPFQITPARTITPTARPLTEYIRLGEGVDEQSSIENLFTTEEGSLARRIIQGEDVTPFTPKKDEDKKESLIPANLPEFWQERYDEYLLLSPYLQSVILENQIKDYIELEPYRTIATEEDGGVSGAAGADVGLEELQRILGQTTGATVNPDGSISFVPGTIDPSTIDVARRIPDPLQLQGYANTGLQDILNIFYANPDRYISEIPLFEDVYDPDTGQVIGQRQVGTQQVLSPVAQAALQAFSTQRGAESADIASRYGTASPFGVIAGAGGETAAEKAIALANLQARAGVTNPFAALGTGSTIGDISTILRGGLSAEQQQQQQLLSALSPLLQASPGTLGGLSRVLGGEAQLRNLFSPFTSSAVQPDTDQGARVQVSQQPPVPSLSSLAEQVSESPFAMQAPRQTVGGYQRADLFERGGIEAEAGMAGEELGRYLGQATPFGGGSPRGSLGAQLV